MELLLKNDCDVVMDQTTKMAGKSSEEVDSESSQVSVLDIFRDRSLLVASIVVGMLW